MTIHSHIVDTALDRYVAGMGRSGIDPEGVSARTLAAAVGVTRDEMSTMLQGHRIAQATPGATRYVMACIGYGQKARWRILAKPGTDTKLVQRARTEQAKHITEDAVRRYLNDSIHEVLCGLRGSDLDDRIEPAVQFASESLESAARFVAAQLNGNAA